MCQVRYKTLTQSISQLHLLLVYFRLCLWSYCGFTGCAEENLWDNGSQE